MAAKINVNDFDRIAAELQALKAAAEAEGTEEAWNKYAFTRDGYDEDTGKFTLAEGYIADENGWVVERDAVTGPTPIK